MLQLSRKCELANIDLKFIMKASEIKQISSTQTLMQVVICFSNKNSKEVDKTQCALWRLANKEL